MTNIHEFISSHEEQPSYVDRTLMDCNNENALLQSGSDMEIFDSETGDPDIQSEAHHAITEGSETVENNVVVAPNDASRICQKIFKATNCKECKENFDLMDRSVALSSVKQLLCSLNRTIANICSHEVFNM